MFPIQIAIWVLFFLGAWRLYTTRGFRESLRGMGFFAEGAFALAAFSQTSLRACLRGICRLGNEVSKIVWAKHSLESLGNGNSKLSNSIQDVGHVSLKGKK